MWILEIAFEFLGYTTARFLLPVLSFGKVTAQPINDKTTPFGAFNAFGCRTDHQGTVVVEATQAAWFGFIVWIFLFVVMLWVL